MSRAAGHPEVPPSTPTQPPGGGATPGEIQKGIGELPGGGGESQPIEAPPDPAAPAPSMPEVGAGAPFTVGNPTASAAFRTPAFFSNRYVGGFRETPVRVGPGAPIDNRIRPVLDPETLRSLVARFGSGGFGSIR